MGNKVQRPSRRGRGGTPENAPAPPLAPRPLVPQEDWVTEEFGAVRLGDQRLERRLKEEAQRQSEAGAQQKAEQDSIVARSIGAGASSSAAEAISLLPVSMA